MNRRVEAWLELVLPPWIDLVQRNARLVLAITLVCTLALGLYTAANLVVDTDEEAVLDDQLPHRVVLLEFRKNFPVLYENIVILVDAQNAEQARLAAAELTDKLRSRPDLFSAVYLPQDEFFEEHSLLYLETEELEDLADRLARVQPYLASLAEDGTLRGLAMMLARGVRAVRDGDVSDENLEPMLERVDASLRASLEGRDYHLSWAEVVAGRPLDQETKRRLILAQPIRDFEAIVAAAKPIDAVRAFSRELGLTRENGIAVRMTGDVALAYEEMTLIETQATVAGIASFIMVGGLLFLGLRSLRLVVATLVSLIVGLVFTGAFATAAIGHLNVISVAFAVLFIGLGVDFGVHLCMGYQESLAAGRPHEEALREAARTVGSSLALCAVTTAIGFYVFIPTDFTGVAELGLISGTGMFLSLFCSLTVLPALISVSLRAETAVRAARRSRRMRLVPSFPMRHPHAVGAATLVIAVGAALLLPQARFDQNPLRVRDPQAESVQAFEELLAKSRTSLWSSNALRPDLESANELAARLRELPSVESAATVVDYIPADQEAKLAIIEDVALFLAPPPAPDGSAPAPSRAEAIAALGEFRTELARFVAEEHGGSLPSARRLHASLGAWLDASKRGAAEADLPALEESLLSTLPRQLEALERSVAVGPITLESLPDGLVERMISESGMVRVQIFPSEDLVDPGALERFVKEVRTLAPNVIGSGVEIYESGRVVVGSFQQAFTAAIIAIAVLLFVIWRALGDMMLVMTPLLLAAMLTGAAAVIVGIPFNFADVIVLPLLLGIGVDSSIHLVHRARIASSVDASLLETSTANAVVFSAATTIASFGSLAFASHRGMASLGQLLTLGVALTVVCNLVVLPALLELRARRARNGRPRRLTKATAGGEGS